MTGLCRVDVDLVGPAQWDYPVHLDGLLMEAAARRLPHSRDVSRANSLPGLLPIYVPLLGQVHAASALILRNPRRVDLFVVRRKDGDDIDRLQRTWTPGSGPGRNQMAREPGWISSGGSWWAWGNPREIQRLLRLVLGPETGGGAIGDRRRHGLGSIRRWSIALVDGPLTEALVGPDGIARRHLPLAWCAAMDGADVVRGALLPPYWHPERQGMVVRVGARVTLAPDITERVEAA